MDLKNFDRCFFAEIKVIYYSERKNNRIPLRGKSLGISAGEKGRRHQGDPENTLLRAGKVSHTSLITSRSFSCKLPERSFFFMQRLSCCMTIGSGGISCHSDLRVRIEEVGFWERT